MAIDGNDAIRILGDNIPVRIHAKGAHQIPILFGAVYELGLIYFVGNVLKHLKGNLHPHPYIHLIIVEMKPECLARTGKPLRSGAPRSCYNVICHNLRLLRHPSETHIQLMPFCRRHNGFYWTVEHHFDSWCQSLAKLPQDAQIIFCT